MLNRIFIRDNLELVRERLALKRYEFDVAGFLALDEREREMRTRVEDLRALRNRTSEEIAGVKKSGGDATGRIVEMREVSAEIKRLEEGLAELEGEGQAFLSTVPNLPDESVPVGPDERSNRVERTVGIPRTFEFPVLDHVDLGSRLGILDMERATRPEG